MKIVETERLVIQQISAADFDNLALVLSEPEIMRYSTVGVHSKAQISAYIASCESQYQQYGFGRWAVYCKANNEFVGICGLNQHAFDEQEVVHINYRLALAQQKKGYAIEMTKGVLAYARENLAADTIFAFIESTNKSSIKVIESTGFDYFKCARFLGIDVRVYQLLLNADTISTLSKRG